MSRLRPKRSQHNQITWWHSRSLVAVKAQDAGGMVGTGVAVMQGGRAPLRGGVRRAVSRVLCPWDLPRCGPPPQGRWPSIYAGGFPPAPAIHPSVDGRAAHGCEHPHSAGSCSRRGLPGRPVTRPPVGSYPTISPSPSPVTAVYFCGTLPEVSLAGCCPAPCSSELGLSSAGRAGRGHLPATQGNIRTRSARQAGRCQPQWALRKIQTPREPHTQWLAMRRTPDVESRSGTILR